MILIPNIFQAQVKVGVVLRVLDLQVYLSGNCDMKGQSPSLREIDVATKLYELGLTMYVLYLDVQSMPVSVPP